MQTNCFGYYFRLKITWKYASNGVIPLNCQTSHTNWDDLKWLFQVNVHYLFSVGKSCGGKKNQQPHRTKIESRVTKNTLCERVFNKKRWFDYICMKSILKTPFKNISMWIHLCKHFPERILQTTYTHTQTHIVLERERGKKRSRTRNVCYRKCITPLHTITSCTQHTANTLHQKER